MEVRVAAEVLAIDENVWHGSLASLLIKGVLDGVTILFSCVQFVKYVLLITASAPMSDDFSSAGCGRAHRCKVADMRSHPTSNLLERTTAPKRMEKDRGRVG